MDQKLQELERILNSDPDNVSAKVRYLKLKSRITGEKDLLIKPLLEKQVWKGTPDPVQDLAIQEVASRLGKDWKLVGNGTFIDYENKGGLEQTADGLIYVEVKKTNKIKMRIAYFEYKDDGIFNLIPGGSMRKRCECRGQGSCSECGDAEYIFDSFYPRLVKQEPFEMDFHSAEEYCSKHNCILGSNLYFEYCLRGAKDYFISLHKNPFGLLDLGTEWTNWTYRLNDEDELRSATVKSESNKITLRGRLAKSTLTDETNPSHPILTRPVFEIPGLWHLGTGLYK